MRAGQARSGRRPSTVARRRGGAARLGVHGVELGREPRQGLDQSKGGVIRRDHLPRIHERRHRRLGVALVTHRLGSSLVWGGMLPKPGLSAACKGYGALSCSKPEES